MNSAISCGDLRLKVNPADGSADLSDSVTNERLISFPNLALLVPSIDSEPGVSVEFVQYDEHAIKIAVSSKWFRAQIRLECTGSCLTIGSRLEVLQDLELNRLDILPPGTKLNLYEVVNFRNRHYTPQLWPELLLGGKGCATDTFSGDWQFAPHPSMMMFRKGDLTLCLGAMDLPTSFGMYFRASDFEVEDISLNYGSPGVGLKLREGEEFLPPMFCLFLDRQKTSIDTARRYTDFLVQSKCIPDPEKKQRFAWHREPLYCTWMDQGIIADEKPADELGEQQLTGSNPTVEACSEPFVHRVLACIDAEDLPFGIFLLDDGWQVTRGHWDAHPERFPDLRGLVDEIHKRGMKVIVWWNWAELFDDALVDEAELAGAGWRNKHGRRIRDYSNPYTQKSYLKPLLRKFFSSEADCFDFDGFKSDFLADKVHPDMPLFDPAWKGEENYCYRLFQLCHSTMREYKPDGCHVGCAGHPFLAEFIDINRTYDVATSNPLEHVNRGHMLEALTPGCPVAYDLHNYVERFAEYFDLAKQNGASVQIGNILGMKVDRFSPWVPTDSHFFDLLRKGLALGPWASDDHADERATAS